MRERVLMIVVLVSVSLTSAMLLAGANTVFYSPLKKEAIKERRLKFTVLKAMGIIFDNDTLDAVFSSAVHKVETNTGILYASVMDDARVAAFVIKGPGFWAPISIVMAVNIEDGDIRGIEVLEQQETPGLGGRISERGFLSQFRGKKVDTPVRLRTKGNAGPNDVEAITGATMTNKAMEKLINNLSRPYMEELRRLKDAL